MSYGVKLQSSFRRSEEYNYVANSKHSQLSDYSSSSMATSSKYLVDIFRDYDVLKCLAKHCSGVEIRNLAATSRHSFDTYKKSVKALNRSNRYGLICDGARNGPMEWTPNANVAWWSLFCLHRHGGPVFDS